MKKTALEFYPSIGYQEALDKQIKFHDLVVKKDMDWALIGLEHKPVISMGKRASFENDIFITAPEIKSRGYEIVTSDRGGQTTIHQPGQLVIYPIIPLRQWRLGVRAYVDLLLQTTKEILAGYGVQAHENEHNPGLYTDLGKIAFVGIRIEKSVSRHGISINVNNDLNDFQLISACGFKQARFDKVQNYLDLSCKEFFEAWHKLFFQKLAESRHFSAGEL